MSDGKSKSEFWWATIAGADCEPVEVTTLNGKRVAYTCGCGDPFPLDEPDSVCVLVDGPERRPLTPAQELAAKEERERQMEADRKKGIKHSWRGPR